VATPRDRRLSAAAVFGFVGSVFGIGLWVLAVAAVTAGGLWRQLEGVDVWLVAGQFIVALVLLLLGVRGATIARMAPMRAAVYLAIAGIAGWVTISRFWLLFGPFYFVGALLAWLGRPRESSHSEERVQSI